MKLSWIICWAPWFVHIGGMVVPGVHSPNFHSLFFSRCWNCIVTWRKRTSTTSSLHHNDILSGYTFNYSVRHIEASNENLLASSCVLQQRFQEGSQDGLFDGICKERATRSHTYSQSEMIILYCWNACKELTKGTPDNFFILGVVRLKGSWKEYGDARL